MQPANTHGFVVKGNGALRTTSERSALSGERLGSGAVTRPVPDHPGLYVRLTASEARQLTDAQWATVVERARAWWAVQWEANQHVEPEPVAADADPKFATVADLPDEADPEPRIATVANLTDETEGIARDPGSEE